MYNLIYTQIIEVKIVKDAYDFGIILQTLRKSKGITQEQLARRINKESSVISRYENNLQAPTFETVRAFAVIFNVSMDYLSGFDKRERISASNISDKQYEIVSSLIEEFRKSNQTSSNEITTEQCKLLGEIVTEFSK